MASNYSSSEANAILEAANAALKRIDEIIAAQKAFAQQISELYGKLVGQRGAGLAKDCKLIRVSTGSYATPACEKKGTKSNLYLAATQSKNATIQTRTAFFDAKECYECMQALAGEDEQSDTFKDLVYAAYKLWMHEEDSGRSASEWEALRAAIVKATKLAAPAQKGALSRLFVVKEDKEMAFDALASLQEVDVAHIAGIMHGWPQCREQSLLSRREVCAAFQQEGEMREHILDHIEAEAGIIALEADDPRPFSSKEAQDALDQLQALSDAPAAVASAREAEGKKVKSAISALQKEEEQARLAAIPIEDLACGKTGAQIDKLQQAGVLTFAELSRRLGSPEAGDLPGVGRVKRQWVGAYVDEVVSKIRKEWRLRLCADERTEAATRVVRAIRAYLELEELCGKAQQALARLEPFEPQQMDDLLFATDQIDWLMADEDLVEAVSGAMRAAREVLGSEDGKWLLLLAPGSEKIADLRLDLDDEDAAWKAFAANPDQFMGVVRALVPSAVRPPEPKEEAARPEAAQPREQKTPGEPKKRPSKPKKSQAATNIPKTKPAAKAKKKQRNSAGNLPAALEGAEDYTLVFSPLEYMGDEATVEVQAEDDGAARAQGTCFSCSVPDGWVFSRETEGRPFILVPDDPEYAGDMPMVSVLYCGMKLSAESVGQLQDYGTSALQWSLKYVAMTMHTADVVEMHEVAGRNCRCAVVQMLRGEGCFEYYIQPYSLTGVDFMRVCFYEPDYVTLKEARAFADGLARTVEISEPATPQCLIRLEERVLGQRSLEDAWYESMQTIVHSLQGQLSNVLKTGVMYCQAKRPNAAPKELHAAGVYAVVQYCDVCAPLMGRLADLLGAWLDHHVPSTSDVAAGKAILGKLETFVVGPELFGTSALSKKELERLLKITPLQKSLRDKIDALRERLGEGGSTEPKAQGAAKLPNVAYSKDGSMDFPVFILKFFSRGWFFFDKGDLSWDGERHGITNLRIDAPSRSEIDAHIRAFDAGFDDMEEVARYAIAFLNTLEADEQLRVPRGRIASGVRRALPEGDLTGITLANLCESSRGLVFGGYGNLYEVYYDGRLARGIPQFFNLVARMLWDLRSIVKPLKGRPFTVAFLLTRSFDSDKYLRAVDDPVPGAQKSLVTMTVSEPPKIKLG